MNQMQLNHNKWVQYENGSIKNNIVAPSVSNFNVIMVEVPYEGSYEHDMVHMSNLMFNDPTEWCIYVYKTKT